LGLLSDIAGIIDVELQQVRQAGPSESEMERARAQVEAHFMYRLQTVGGFGGKSDQLNAYNVLRGDPGFFSSDVSRYRDATAEAVCDAATRFLAFDRRVTLCVVPRGQQRLAIPGSRAVAAS
jgi:zinc protease